MRFLDLDSLSEMTHLTSMSHCRTLSSSIPMTSNTTRTHQLNPRSLRQQQEAVTGVQKSQPKLDLSLKQGETININLAAVRFSQCD